MAQKPFVLKSGKFIKLAELKRVSYRPIRRQIDTIAIPGIGKCPVMESTGRLDKSRIDLWTDMMNFSVEATHDGVKEKIRRLRQQEADALDLIDAQISLLRLEREDLIKKAWQAGNTVTVKELVERIVK